VTILIFSEMKNIKPFDLDKTGLELQVSEYLYRRFGKTIW